MSASNLIVELTLVVLVVLSIVTWSIGLIKVRQWRRAARQETAFLEAFWKERGWAQRAQAAREGEGDFAELARTGFQTCQELAGEEGEGCEPHELQEILARELRKQVMIQARRRERGLAELASIGSTAPFIGLFGTVWGIMNALKTITASGQASIDVVAGPIGEALIATAVGIATAVPAVLIYNYFLRRQRVHATEVGSFVDDFERGAMRHRKQWGDAC